MLAKRGKWIVAGLSRLIARPRLAFSSIPAFVVTGLFGAAALAQSVTATNVYDDAGRLKSTTYSDGKTVSYEYDAAGNRLATSEGVPLQVSIAGASATEGGTLIFTITKAGTATGTVSVDCAQTNGSATAGSDAVRTI